MSEKLRVIPLWKVLSLASLLTITALSVSSFQTISHAAFIAKPKCHHKIDRMLLQRGIVGIAHTHVNHECYQLSFYERRRSILLKYAHTRLNNVDLPHKEVSSARRIISLIELRYGGQATDENKTFLDVARSNGGTDNQRNNVENTTNFSNTSRFSIPKKLPSRWAKTRRYIYGATSNSTSTPLTEEQVLLVIMFLEKTFCDDDKSLNLDSDYSKSSWQGKDIVISILQTRPRILRKNVDSYLNPTVEFLRSLYPGPMFYQAVQRNPNLLLTSGVGYNYNSKISKGNNVVDKKSKINDMVTTEQIFKSSEDPPRGNFEEVASYLENENLGLSFNRIQKMKKSHPSLFQLSVQHKIKPIIEFLLSLCLATNGEEEKGESAQLFVEKQQRLERRSLVGKMLMANPNILNLSLHSNLVPKVNFLQRVVFKSSYEDMIPLWKKCPGILGMSLEENLKPKVFFIEGLLSMTQEDVWLGRDFLSEIHNEATDIVDNTLIKKCLVSHPQLLLLSMDNIASKVSYFNSINMHSQKVPCDDRTRTETSELNAKERKCEKGTYNRAVASLAARIAICAPSVFSLSIEDNILPTIECLSRAWGNESLGTYLAEYPTILTLSLEGNIIPTLQFFNRTGYINLNEDGHSVGNGSCIPARYIASSLFNRLLPRWSYFVMGQRRKIGIEAQVDFTSNSFKIAPLDEVCTTNLPLYILAGASDQVFCKQMGLPYSSFLTYKKEMSPQLKFNTQFGLWLKTGRPIDVP